VNFVLLHGFWGSPSDFAAIEPLLNADRVWTPNLFEPGPLDSSHSLEVWTRNFAREMKDRFGDEPAQIVGYSQGARLALHAIIQNPNPFSRAWLLSAHPGQLSEEERAQRFEWIRVWKKKFLEQEWASLAKDWDRQEVFSGSSGPASPRPQPSRRLLAQALENWSLLQHRFGWEDLRSLSTPVTWVFGALDQKFLAVKERLQVQNVQGRFWVVERAGHRLLQDAPEALALQINERT
jgi:2-succinyl-6-hydroxy-2,4-cyclohexadiene-1-carboxylate synthase